MGTMECTFSEEGNATVVAVNGRLDTITSLQFKEILDEKIDDVQELVLDFTDLAYLSSAGLRVVVYAYQYLEEKGLSMRIRNVNDTVMKVFHITGLAGDLAIE